MVQQERELQEHRGLAVLVDQVDQQGQQDRQALADRVGLLVLALQEQRGCQDLQAQVDQQVQEVLALAGRVARLELV